MAGEITLLKTRIADAAATDPQEPKDACLARCAALIPAVMHVIEAMPLDVDRQCEIVDCWELVIGLIPPRFGHDRAWSEDQVVPFGRLYSHLIALLVGPMALHEVLMERVLHTLNLSVKTATLLLFGGCSREETLNGVEGLLAVAARFPANVTIQTDFCALLDDSMYLNADPTAPSPQVLLAERHAIPAVIAAMEVADHSRDGVVGSRALCQLYDENAATKYDWVRAVRAIVTAHTRFPQSDQVRFTTLSSIFNIVRFHTCQGRGDEVAAMCLPLVRVSLQSETRSVGMIVAVVVAQIDVGAQEYLRESGIVAEIMSQDDASNAVYTRRMGFLLRHLFDDKKEIEIT